MTPEDFAQRLQAALESRLVSVILYGSAAAGDHIPKRSDYNLLVVLDRIGLEELKVMSTVVRAWVRSGNPFPRLFTQQGLARSTDAFPLELLDIQAAHRVLIGEDVVGELSLSTRQLRFELEHELKGKLIQLRQRYVLTHGHPRRVTELMTRSLSTFLVLLRGVLRLYQPRVPVKKLDVLPELARHLPVAIEPFEMIADLKAGRRVPCVVPDRLFAQYLEAITTIVETVDRHVPAQS